ncbi:hypothetical protein CURTO8I2_140012 [Curtobacterium sp. 8I-2]|nr:hypothetical protein CURTO8I2_140012 [Curtobacterium sp. 8I-2]
MTQSASRPGTRSINKLALTMCTLLSSQGPDALPARPTKGFRQRGIRLVQHPGSRPEGHGSEGWLPERDPVRTASPGVQPGDRLGRSVLRLSGNE